MRKDVREFIRRLEAAGLTVESTPGHYHVLRDGKPLRKQNLPSTLPFSPDTIRWRRSAVVELRKLGIDLWQEGSNRVTAKKHWPSARQGSCRCHLLLAKRGVARLAPQEAPSPANPRGFGEM
jgi:hypothetical protein